MRTLLFDILELLNAVALFPCLFAIILLLVLARNPLKVIVPALFFVTLSASFFLALSALYESQLPWLPTLLLWLESMQPAMCFLLVIQLWTDRAPKGVYWLILALPIVGGTSLVFASQQLVEACILNEYCLPAAAFRGLYQLFATAAIFMLMMAHLSHTPIAYHASRIYQSHRYWLIVTLILAYLSMLFFDLMMLAGNITYFQNDIIHVVLRLGFVYLVLTSLFRVFDHASQGTSSVGAKPIDPEVVTKIEAAMQDDKLYREMGFSREKCAEKLELQEHVLSRTINQAFDKNFNEYVNSYRIEEAKERLAREDTSVTAIAFEVGFSSIASFNRVFKAMVQCSPTEYRASAANGATQDAKASED